MTRLLAVLWKIALAVMVVESLAGIVRDGQYILALVAVFIPIGVVLLKSRGSLIRKIRFVDGTSAKQGPVAIRQLSALDRDRISTLAASGNSIKAIAALRKLVKIDLRAARDVVDQLASGHRVRSSGDENA